MVKSIVEWAFYSAEATVQANEVKELKKVLVILN
jgi:hypothetical protein